METYEQSIEMFIHSNQSWPRFAGSIFKSNKGFSKSLAVIGGNKAKLGVLLSITFTWFILLVTGCYKHLHIQFILENKTNRKLNASEKININLANLHFSVSLQALSGIEFKDEIKSFVSSLVLKKQNISKVCHVDL